jgi:hypothetical protein
MINLDLDAIEARVAAATNGPFGTWDDAEQDPLRVDVLALVAKVRELMRIIRGEDIVDAEGRQLFCPRCGHPDSEGYPREVLDA